MNRKRYIYFATFFALSLAFTCKIQTNHSATPLSPIGHMAEMNEDDGTSKDSITRVEANSLRIYRNLPSSFAIAQDDRKLRGLTNHLFVPLCVLAPLCLNTSIPCS